MSSTTVRVDSATQQILRSLAEAQQVTMTEALRRAVEAAQRAQFLDEVNAGYAALRANREAWDEECAERELWDMALSDGLEEERP